MIHVITGDGKGKTTASIGLSIRAAGHGFSVLFVQFLKDDTSGELAVLKDISAINTLHPSVNYGFTFQMTKAQLEDTAKDYSKMLEIIKKSNAFLIVLDEAICALNAGLIERSALEQILNIEAEIVLTGRDAPSWLIEKADYVSEVKKVVHPYDKGIAAREGIEY